MTTLTEADTCRRYVLPKLYAASWTDDQISEQKSFTDGRIIVSGSKVARRPQKCADYLLKYRRDFTLAVVEAKPVYKKPGDGLQNSVTGNSFPNFHATQSANSFLEKLGKELPVTE
jgi:type I restriction enzyme R subunit